MWDLDLLGESARPSEGPALVYSIHELKVLGTSDHCSPNLERRRVGGKRPAWLDSHPACSCLHGAGAARGRLGLPTAPAGPAAARGRGDARGGATSLAGAPTGSGALRGRTAGKPGVLPATAMTLGPALLLRGVPVECCRSQLPRLSHQNKK